MLDKEIFDRLKEKVLVKRPILREILEKRGQKKLYDYATEYVSVNLNPAIHKRQEEFISSFYSEAASRISEDVAKTAIAQLRKYYFASTADHLGPITSPFFVNSNFLTAAPYQQRNDPDLKHVIVLACANISLDNSSLPRGLLFHNQDGGKLQTNRLAFFSANTRPPVVYTLPPYTLKDIKKIKNAITVLRQKDDISDRGYEILNDLFDKVYAREDVLACKNYSQQISRTNNDLWQCFFAEGGYTLPNLVYLELEGLVTRLIIDHHLYRDTLINHLLFDPVYEPVINQYFDDIFGSFSRKTAKGTYLFWALPPGQRYALQLWRQGNYLVSKNGNYKIELHPDVIKKAMEEKELIPGLMLDFVVVSFYYGLKCLGGFNQVNYLTYMKNAYLKMNTDLGNYRSIEVCSRSQTKELCDGLTVAFLKHGNETVLATGLDLMLFGDKSTYPTLLQVTKEITVEEALNPLLPEIYRITYDKREWESDLLAITDRDINKLTNLDTKIRPCLDIPCNAGSMDMPSPN